MTRFILVRHGESEANTRGCVAGQSDVPLTSLGREQAMQTAKRLEKEQIDVIYTSDLMRAHDTAVPHAVMRGLAVIDDEQLREVNCGDWEGKPFADAAREDPALFAEMKTRFGTFTPPNGENFAASGVRLLHELERIASRHEGKTVLIVSHGATIRGFWCAINGVPAEDMAKAFPYPSNASYSIAEFDGERFIPVLYSEDSHITTVTKLSAI